MSKEEQIKELSKSLEDGVLNKEEFEKQKKKIEEEPDVEQKHEEDTKKTEEIHRNESKKSDKMLIFLILGLILIIVAFFSYRFFMQEPPETLDEYQPGCLGY